MNGFDVRILLFLNQFANHSRWLDWFATRAYSNSLTSGGTVMTLAWYVLFDRKEKEGLRKDFDLVLSAMFLCGAATLAARALAVALPFRTRPMWTPALHFQLPKGADLLLMSWSSFPSDHATLFYALATGILLVSRPLGCLAIIWTAAFTSFPAIYLGVHWPTDVIAGALLGACFTCLAKIPAWRTIVIHLATSWYREYAGLFFAALFLWSYEVVTLFEDGVRILRAIGRFA